MTTIFRDARRWSEAAFRCKHRPKQPRMVTAMGERRLLEGKCGGDQASAGHARGCGGTFGRLSSRKPLSSSVACDSEMALTCEQRGCLDT
jgi:hypothetical protein